MPCCKTLAKSYLYVINTLFILVGLATLAASVAIAAAFGECAHSPFFGC